MTPEKRAEYEKLLHGRLSKHRYEHSLNVADEAVRLAKKYGADAEKAELAGLLHDVMKEDDEETQLEYMLRYDRRRRINSKPNLCSGKLYHGPAAAGYCYYELKIRDPEVLSSIYYHTTAKGNMTLLEKIIYIADYTSRERKYKDVDHLRALVDKDLDEAIRYSLEYTIMKNLKARYLLHPKTFEAYNSTMEQLYLSGK